MAEKKPKIKVYIPRSQRAVVQGLLNNEQELTPIEDMDNLEEDAPMLIETPRIIPSAPQILKQTAKVPIIL